MWRAQTGSTRTANERKQAIGFERDRQLGRSQVLVDHRFHAGQLTGVRPGHRYAAAPAADHEHAGFG